MSRGLRATGERNVDEADTIITAIMDARHQFAYELVREFIDYASRVLEVGFGQGYGPGTLASSARLYEGLEVDPVAMEHTDSKEFPPNVGLQLYDGVNIPFPNDAFDLVFALQVVEHVAKLEAWLADIDRVCRPGGTIVVTTPNRTHRVMDGERPWNRFHLVEWNPAEFEQVLKAQFDNVQVSGISATPQIMQIEFERVRRIRRIARIDPLRLRERLPAALIHQLSKTFAGGSRNFGTLAVGEISPEAFHHHEDSVESSLDIVGIVTVR